MLFRSQAEAKLKQQRGEEAKRWLDGHILPRVEARWLRPTSAKNGMTCIISIRTTPGGQVVDARVTKSSGDPSFDRSAEGAVRKASPLPMPPDPKVAQQLHSFILRFRPQ